MYALSRRGPRPRRAGRVADEVRGGSTRALPASCARGRSPANRTGSTTGPAGTRAPQTKCRLRCMRDTWRVGTRREVVAKAATGVPEPVSKPVSGPFIDLNADVGEVEDPELLEVGGLQIVTRASIATGAN